MITDESPWEQAVPYWQAPKLTQGSCHLLGHFRAGPDKHLGGLWQQGDDCVACPKNWELGSEGIITGVPRPPKPGGHAGLWNGGNRSAEGGRKISRLRGVDF